MQRVQGDSQLYPNLREASALTVAVGDQLPIQVCGRTCHVDARSGRSFMDIQVALQRAVGMHEQDFDLCDSLGSRICTDLALHDALDRGHTPLQATLSDASVHFIENRREELAQMQWKVMRDKIQGCSSDVLTLSRQIAELKQQMEVQRRQSETAMEVLRGELVKATEQEHVLTQAGLQQLSERITSTISLVNGEQNKREFAHQTLEHQIQDLRLATDSERATRMKETDHHLHMLKDAKVAFEAQKQIMESAEKQHAFDVQELKAEIANSSRSFSAMVDEQMRSFRTSAEDVAQHVRNHDSEINRKLAELQNRAADSSKLLSDVDVRCDSLDMRLSQAISNQADCVQKLSDRQEQVAQVLESVRLEKQHLAMTIQSNVNHIKELETSVAKSEDEARKMVEREGTAVRDELERAQRQLVSNQGKQIAELEMKVAERLELESSSREANSKQIYQEIGKVVGKRHSDDSSLDNSDITTVPSVSPAHLFARSPPTPNPRLFAVTQGGSTVIPRGMTSGLSSAGSGKPAWNSFGQTPRPSGASGTSVVAPPASAQLGCPGISGIVSPRAPVVTRSSFGGSVVIHRTANRLSGSPGAPAPTRGVRSFSADVQPRSRCATTA